MRFPIYFQRFISLLLPLAALNGVNPALNGVNFAKMTRLDFILKASKKSHLVNEMFQEMVSIMMKNCFFR